MHRDVFIALLAAVAAATGPAARAQAPLYAGSAQWYRLHQGLPGPFTPSYAEGVALRFNGDPEMDYVGRVGGSFYLWVDPANHDAHLELPMIGHALTIQPDFRVGGPQAIVVAGDAGLERWWFDAEELRFDFLDESAWIGARLVSCGQFTQDERWDFVGVGPTLQAVLFSTQTEDGDFASTAGFTLPQPARQMVVLDVDQAYLGDGVQEIAFRYDAGVDIRATSGVRRCAILPPPGNAIVTMARMRDGAADLDRLAIISWDEVLQQQVLRIHDGQGNLLGEHSLQEYKAVTCTAVDLDGQGDSDELALSLTSHTYPVVLRFEGFANAPIFESFALNLENPPAPGNDATVVAGDFDHDGDQDLIFPNHQLDDFIVYRGYAVDEMRMAPTRAWGDDLGGGLLTLAFDRPEELPPSAQLFELSVWTKRGAVAQIPTAFIDSPIPRWTATAELDEEQQEYVFTLDLEDDAAAFANGMFHLYCMVRVSRQDASGVITQAAPANVLVVSGSMETAEALHASVPWPLPEEPAALDPNDLIGAGAYPQQSVTPHPDDLPPPPPPPTGGAGGGG